MLARLHLRRPSHGTVVAYLALFVALGGSAYAAATIGPSNIKNDAVRSRHIKDGAVKNPDLGANSVGTGKVLDNTLTGADINELTLGKVPSAANADSANSLNGATAADFVSAGTVRRFGPVVVSPGQGPNLLSVGPFTFFVASCVIANPHGEAAIQLSSSEAHSAYSAFQASAGSGNGTRGSGDFSTALDLGTAEFASGTPGMSIESGTAVAPSGKQITFQVYEATEIGGQTGKCVFGGTVIANN
jgi:hypothetical protein